MMAASGYDPLPSGQAVDPPPAYDPIPAAGPTGGYQAGAGVANPAYPAYKDPCQAAAPYPGSYQAGAPYSAYPGPAAGAMPPGYQQDPTVVHVVQPTQNVIVIGGCPACRVGVLEDEYPCLGICCAIVFFPLGVLCCLAMKQRHCPNCGAIFG